jgi:ABC-type uncharacterized transport system permease subunit
MFSALVLLVALCYALAAVWGCGFFVSPSRFSPRVAFRAGCAGFALHTVVLAAWGAKAGHFPATDVFEMLAFFVWCGVLLYIAASCMASVPSLSAFVMPLAAAFMGAAAAAVPDAAERIQPRTVWIAVHGIVALLGAAGFLVAFILAVMYLLQDRQLKLRVFGRLLERLPSLEEIDRLLYRALVLGFTFYTVSLFVGAVMIYDLGKILGQADGRRWLVLSVIAWLVYALLLHTRARARLRGRKLAYVAMLGFVLVGAAFAGIMFGVHKF